MRILLVEDDNILGDGLQVGLKQSGYTVDWLQDGKAAEIAFKTTTFDFVILDLGLPGKDGLSILKTLRRAKNKVPVLILTAKTAIEDRVTGLNAGADDYLGKPFDLDELVARIEAISRRHLGHADPVIEYKDIKLNTKNHKLFKSDVEVELSLREFTVINTLLSKTGTIISRAQLEEIIYGWEQEIESNAIEVHIHNLRKKLGKDLIKTIRGVGYIINYEQ